MIRENEEGENKETGIEIEGEERRRKNIENGNVRISKNSSNRAKVKKLSKKKLRRTDIYDKKLKSNQEIKRTSKNIR